MNQAEVTATKFFAQGYDFGLQKVAALMGTLKALGNTAAKSGHGGLQSVTKASQKFAGAGKVKQLKGALERGSNAADPISRAGSRLLHASGSKGGLQGAVAKMNAAKGAPSSLAKPRRIA